MCRLVEGWLDVLSAPILHNNNFGAAPFCKATIQAVTGLAHHRRDGLKS
jgi:hypothetical protein